MAKMKKKELGKGIRALLSNAEQSTSQIEQEEIVKELSSHIAMIPLDQIEINPFQPRSQFDEEELRALTQSIKTHGIIQPLTLRRLGQDSFQIISGERRFRAASEAGLSEVPAYIRLADDQAMLELALVENIQRQDLNAIEVAISYKRLMDECSLTHDTLSERVGKNRSTVTNYIRLLKLSPEIQQAIKDRKLSMGHARALAGMSNIDEQIHVFKSILERGLSVRGTESLIQSLQSNKKKRAKKELSHQHPEVRKIESRLTDRLNTQIKIQRNKSGKGKIVIPFEDDDRLNAIIDILDA
ncbi:MAG: ParB/RepB/Spo0J family partition protein [Bacteroidetes bacterium]|jgi:ParB family chromosome partitioning protein|nr:ParB/RepB/Spo0J family partition protein [Bacteroidota bacterium]